MRGQLGNNPVGDDLPGKVTDHQQAQEEHRQHDPCCQRGNDPIGFTVILGEKKQAGDQANQDQRQIDDNQYLKPHRSLGLLHENASITARYRFQPSVFTTLLTLVMVGIFAALSLWQYQRANYKDQVAQAVAQQSAQAALNLNQTAVDWPAQRFHPATVSGQWEANSTVLLDNIVQQGKAGYHVITPFRLTNGQHLLVNRGWIEVGADRKVLPAITTPQDDIQLSGTLDTPRSKPVFLFGDVAADSEGNQRWLYLDVTHFAHKLGYPLAPYVVLQTSAAPDGLQRDWPAYSNNAGMHIGYSIQWAAFGLMVLVAYFKMNLHKTNRETP